MSWTIHTVQLGLGACSEKKREEEGEGGEKRIRSRGQL